MALAVGAISGDVGCAYRAPPKQFGGDVRLVFPRIDHGGAHPVFIHGSQQGFRVDHAATGGVDQDGAALQEAEEAVVGQVIRGMSARLRQGRMKSDDVTASGHLLQRDEGTALGLLTGWIVQQELAPQGLQSLHHGPTNVAHAHNAHAALRRAPASLPFQHQQRVAHVLSYRSGIATGAIRPGYAGLAKVVDV